MTCVFGLEYWLGFLTWVLDLRSWIGTSNASNVYVVFHKLDFSMNLLGPRYILQTGLIGLHALERIHILCHLI
jgi:hypothetical protein